MPQAARPLPSLYETDFVAWCDEQAKLLRAGRFRAIDVENVAEELESMGDSQRNELANRLEVLLAHMLKTQFQPEKETNSWRATIAEQRRRIRRVLEQSPSLKHGLVSVVASAYRDAREAAAIETELPIETFPEQLPWSLAEILPPT